MVRPEDGAFFPWHKGLSTLLAAHVTARAPQWPREEWPTCLQQFVLCAIATDCCEWSRQASSIVDPFAHIIYDVRSFFFPRCFRGVALPRIFLPSRNKNPPLPKKNTRRPHCCGAMYIISIFRSTTYMAHVVTPKPHGVPPSSDVCFCVSCAGAETEPAELPHQIPARSQAQRGTDVGGEDDEEQRQEGCPRLHDVET